MKIRFLSILFLFIIWIAVGQVFNQPMVYASINPADINYLSNDYAVILAQFEEVWVEQNFEGCGEESNPCGYWGREYDDAIQVNHEDAVMLDFDKQTDFYFDGPRPDGVECEIYGHQGELFYLVDAENGARQFVSEDSLEGFQLQEGVYEADFYFDCIYQVRNDKSLFTRVFAWLKPRIAYAEPYGEYIGTIRFNITDKNALPPEPLTLQEKAAELAKELVNQPDAYLWGGKGWDKDIGEFITSADILSGYTYWNPNKDALGKGDWDVGIGVDCSGLVTWAFNRANDPLKSAANNFIKYVNADGLHGDYQSDSVDENDLRPGDALFFNWDGDDDMDHVAMYVGENIGYDVVNAASIDQGIIASQKDLLSAIDDFVDFRRIHDARVAMSIKSGSPVDLIVSDPGDFTITPDTIIDSEEEYIREIPGALYYVEMEKAKDGNPADRVYSPILKTGSYVIRVIPIENAQPTDTYSLEFTIGNNTIKLAENVSISEIPEEGYFVEVGEAEEVESSGEITSEYLLGKIRSYIQGFEINDRAEKTLLALVGVIEKRIEINRKLQEKLVKHAEKLKENERAILKELSLAEKVFMEKENQKLTNKEVVELTKVLAKVLTAFRD